MLKSLSAILAAAAVAAVVTTLSSPTERVTAGPLPQAASQPMQVCAERPWPYLRCVGTPFGSRHVRLVTTERLSH